MKCAVLAVLLILALEANQNKAETTQSTLSSVPQWYNPCHHSREGRSQNKRDAVKENLWERKFIRRLAKIRRQLNTTMEEFNKELLRDSYKDIQSKVDKLQFVLKWVPGMGNVLIFFDENSTWLQISTYLPIMHKELQKFAVAMEAVVQGDRQRAIVGNTNTYLIQFLCEVEGALVAQQIGVPAPREERSLMKDEERNPPDMTQHLVRDWGILTKYRNYVHYWYKLLYKMLKYRKSGNLRINGSQRTPTA